MVFNRRTTFLTAALEALLAVAVTFGILLVTLTLLWAVENNASVDWMAAYRTAADIWLAAHGVPIQVSAQTIAGVATPAFAISMVPLAFTALIVFLAYRAGTRLAASGELWPGWLAAAAVYGGVSTLVANSSVHELAAVNPAQGTFQPPIIYTAIVMLASLVAKPADLGVANLPVAVERMRLNTWARARWDAAGWWMNVVLPPAIRAGSAIVVMLLGFSALMIALQLALGWIDVVRLYEGLQLTMLGGVLLTAGQLAFLPNFVVFGADWFTGAGFAIGTGSAVAPTGTSLGPIPALPIFAVIPTGTLAFGLAAIAVPIVASVISVLFVKGHAGRMRFEFANPISAAASLGVPVALVAALEMLLLNVFAAGGIGPQRLQEVGANPFVVAAIVFVEVAVSATAAAFFSTRPDAPDHQAIARASQPIKRTNYYAENNWGGSGFEPED